jgi:hypothetical protein
MRLFEHNDLYAWEDQNYKSIEMRDCSSKRWQGTEVWLAWCGMALAMWAIFVPNAANAAVWATRSEWDEASEKRYAEWVEEHFDAHFFYEGTHYSDMPTDCADAAYGMRMAFAYEQGLPFAIEHEGSLITQNTRKFDALPAGLPRLRAFMNWVMENTSTRTLVRDTYPVRIDREQIRPGVIYLSAGVHAMQIVQVRDYGVIRYLESTAPRAIRPMRSILGFPHQVPADPRASANSDGFRRFKTPADYAARRPADLPGYSLEQFAKARELQRETLPFYEWVQSRLALEPEPVASLAHRSMFSICAMAYDRANAVEEALVLQALARQQGRRLSAQEIDEHSTPSRDRLLLRAMEHLKTLVVRADWPGLSTKYRGFVELMVGRLPETQQEFVRADLKSWCDLSKVDGGPVQTLDLQQLFGLLQEGRLSSSPLVSRARRWGAR